MNEVVEVIEPISTARYPGGTGPYLHLYDSCPSVKRAINRDGEVLRSRTTMAAILAMHSATLCGWCRRKRDAAG